MENKEIEILPGVKGKPFFKNKEEENAYKERMDKISEELREAALDRARKIRKITHEELLERIQNLERIVKEQDKQLERLVDFCNTVTKKLNPHRDY